MTDAWPTDLPHGVIDFEPIGGGRSGGAFSGMAPAIDASPGGPHWRATVSGLSLHRTAQILAARALEGILDGGAGSVFVPVCDGRLRPSVTSAAFSGPYTAGETDIALDYVGDTLIGGEHFSVDHGDATVGRRLYRLVEDRSGVWRITPPLRADVDADTVIDFADPSCPMRLESGFDLPIELQRFGSVEASFVEYFERSPAPAVDDLTPEPAPDARYWRVRSITTHDGDVRFRPGEIRFLDDWAGAVIDPVTPIASPASGGSAATAFDGDFSTTVILAGSGGWIGQDNGVAKPRPTEFWLQSGVTGDQTSMPSALAYEEGDDDGSGGIAWTTVKTFTDIPRWFEAELRYFAIGDEADAGWASPPLWRRQRVRAISVLAPSPYFKVAELRLLDDELDTETIAGTYNARRKLIGTSIGYLFDNESTTYVGVDWTASDNGFDCDNGIDPRAQVQAVRMQAVVFFGPEGAPTDFVLEGSNWEGKYHQIARFPTAGPWPGTRTFTIV